MNHPASRSFVAVAACAAGLLLLAAHAPAQSPGYNPNRVVVGTASSPYWGYTYTPYATTTPLHGVAEIIRAQGDFLIKKEETRLLRLQVREEWLDVHRQELEHCGEKRGLRQGKLGKGDGM